MDILRKELNTIYAAQGLDEERLDASLLREAIERVKIFTSVNDCGCVITDASADTCHIIGGRFYRIIGISDSDTMCAKADSSDEDVIYARLHPEDLVEKRMLEYEFFKHVDPLDSRRKKDFKATCTIRIRDARGEFINVANSTQIFYPSQAGKIWLILCCYSLSPLTHGLHGIDPHIVNTATGEVLDVPTEEGRANILTAREKEILRLIGEGNASKQIADMLGISIHTVSRHRQNILEKLSVGNSLEAVKAAALMRLL